MPDGPEPPDEALRCDCGLEAVTAHKEVPADRVTFAVRSCARVADAVTNSVIDDGLVLLTIRAPNGREREVGPMPIAKSFDWMRELSMCTSADAWRRMKRMSPDG